LNGTLYDPEDIQRFNGQELHFVPAANRDHILVVDDRDVMVKWWQLSQLSGIAEAAKRTPAPREDTIDPHSYFREDLNYEGDFLYLLPGYWWPDLTQVSMTGLFSGDWNDEISSVSVRPNQNCVLHEHINGEGSSVTLYNNEPYLEAFGWNDRASSVETW